MNNQEIKNRIISIADSVRAEIMFDISVKVNFFEFSKLVMIKNNQDIKTLCSSIYKYYN